MSTIIHSQDMSEVRSQAGWTLRTVADASHIGAPAMVANWWIFEPGAQGPRRTRGQADELLYVIRGTGKAVVDDNQTFDLDEESVLWVEENETYYFIAGENGLEILQGQAPGDWVNGRAS